MNIRSVQLGVVLLLTWLCVARASVFYVDVRSTSPTPPYASWSTASTDIQSAIDAASDGDTILVNDGVYQTGGRVVYGSLTNRVAINKAVTVRSINGPAATVIQGYEIPGVIFGDAAVRCVYMTNNAMLAGFTLTNGATRCNCAYSAGTPNFNQEQSAGGVWCESASATVSNCVVAGNMAYGNVGGAYSGTFDNCYFTGNSGGVFGGGAWNSVLNNCSLTGNSSVNVGGGAYTCSLTNCTLIGNSSGAAYCNLNNCIIYYNTAWNTTGCTLSNCCTVPNPGGINITNEPQMADYSHISSTSPCLGAGNAAWVTGPDIDGETFSNPPAIGCDEYHPGHVFGPLSTAVQTLYTSAATFFPISFSAQIAGHASLNVWDFGDGTTVSNRLYVSHRWLAPGSYPVTFTVYNDSNPSGVSTTTTILISAETHYVNLQNSAPVSPYNSWVTAATNIQDAVDSVVLPGAVVLVTNGIYQAGGRIVYGAMSNRVAVTQSLVLQSVNGPAVTTIQGHQVPGTIYGDSAVRCVWLTNNSCLFGFTLTGGATRQAGDTYQEESAGGILCLDPSCVVSNCVVTGNSAYGADSGSGTGGGGGGGTYGGTFYSSQFTSNSAPNGNGGGANGSVLNQCTLTGNQAGYGGGGFGCTFDNCWITNNSAGSGGGSYGYGALLNNCMVTGNSAGVGGGVFGSTMNNCTVVGNTASSQGGGAWNGSGANSIIYSNAAPAGANWYTGSYPYCCTDPAYDVGAFSSPPLFMNQAGGDLHLQSNSPCINAGSNGSVISSVDLDGNLRVVGPIVDVGAYEYQTPTIAIVLQPTNQVQAGGQFALFSVAAVSPYLITYQWQFNSANINGATNSTLVLSNIQSNNAGAYSAILANGFLNVTSAAASLGVVYPPPVIVTQPASQLALVGSNATFSLNATSYYAMTFQWQFNGTNLVDGPGISGSTTPVLNVFGASVSTAGNYQAIVANQYAASTSAVAALTLVYPPGIAAQPTNEMVIYPNNASFAVQATGTAPFGYQWYSNGVALANGGVIGGANAATLAISSPPTNYDALYQAVVTNAYGAITSSPALLTVYVPPQFAVQPANQAVLIGSNAAFNVTVTGMSPISYQWYFNGSPLFDDGRISGSATPSLSISNVQSSDAGVYRVMASNFVSTAMSSPATLTALTTPGPSIRYVNLSNPNPASPYVSWSTAATNIQDAIDAAVDGDQILVTNGVYQYGGRVIYGLLTNRVAINRVVTVQSVNGPTATVIQGYQVPGTNNGDSAVRCVYLTNNAVLSGFTLNFGATRKSGGLNEQSGGGAWCEGTNTTIVNCVLKSNSAWFGGGGASYGTLINCALTDNFIDANTYGGGATYFSTCINCLVARNRAYPAAGGGASSTFINCTVVSNLCVGFELSAAQTAAGTSCTFKNCIVYYNLGQYTTTPIPSSGINNYFNCCLYPMVGGSFSSVFTNGPLFVDFLNGNYHLQPWSLCVNAGNNTFLTNTTDLDGNPRVRAGIVDLGAYENQSTNVTHFVFLNNHNPVTPYTNWLTAATNIQDAIDAANAREFVIVSNGTYQVGGRTVGGYALTNRVAVTKAVTVESLYGPGVTVIQGKSPGGVNAIRCVYLTNGATLTGFTLTNGATLTSGNPSYEVSGGGLLCESVSAVASNCVVVGNMANNGGGVEGGTLNGCTITRNSATYGGGVSGYSQSFSDATISNLLVNCIIASNSVNGHGGGAFGSTLYNCLVTSNTTGFAYTGGGAAYSTLTDCVISNNSTPGYQGGGVSFSTLNNCLVVRNWAQSDGGGALNSTLNNCTVASNTVPNGSGGGVYSCALTNSLVYYNSGSANPNYAGTTFNYCDTMPLAPGAGNITNPPSFANLVGGNFHLQSNSPCINSGDNAYVSAATDLDGNPRIVVGTVDMGAYEYQTPTSILSYAWAQQYGLPMDGSVDYLDLDGTGMQNWQKSMAGLNPTNPASALVMLPLTATNNSNGVKVSWQSVNNRMYYLQRTMDLTVQPPFSTIQNNLVGQPGTTSFTDTTATNGGPYFYRVGVQ
jgi:hypothetical protein